MDIRGSELTADQVDNLRLAGAEKETLRNAFPVMEATIDGELLRIRVAELATPAEPHVWRLRQAPTFLVTSLRDELAALADGGLANLLARGEVGGRLASVTRPLPLDHRPRPALFYTGIGRKPVPSHQPLPRRTCAA